MLAHCGHVAIVGRPNVGKSTLLNHILGQKISITSRRPQTTRHAILGIKTEHGTQVVYVDTPGLHRAGKRAMNRYMNRAAKGALSDVDVVVFLVEAMRWTVEDEHVCEMLKTVRVPVILAVNKVDKISDKTALLPFLQTLSGKMDFAHIIPLAARSGHSVAVLEEKVRSLLPPGEAFYPEDQVTDRSERFLAAELIREKLMQSLGQELPYAATVQIEKFSPQDAVLHIDAIIWVERSGQKAIVIGEGGKRLKEIGRRARLDMERQFEGKVFLQMWVKVKEDWSDNEQALASLGFD
jgi:GTP-binding protein Era